MFTYGYIREATMAHLDIDETEAQAMNLLSRFHIYANEAMQAICASKPMYQYINITVVKKFAPLVMDDSSASGAFLRLAAEDEINWNEETQGTPDFVLATEEQTKAYWHEKGVYEVNEKIQMSDTFIAFANKQCIKIVTLKPTVAEQLEAEAFGYKAVSGISRGPAKIDEDFSYIGKNQLKFYKEGEYYIPAKYLWYRFDSGLGDDAEIDIPADILLTIPLYIAAVCLQVDNMQKAQILRQEFEMALARCTSTDFMTLNEFKADWR